MKIKVSLLLVILLALGWYQTTQLVLKTPANIREHIARAEKYEKKEIYEDALEEYRLAVQLGEKDGKIRRKVAEMQLKLEDTSGFISTCEALIYDKSMDEEALKMLTDYYASDGKKSVAVELLKELRSKNQNSKTLDELWNTYRGYYEETPYSYDAVTPFYQGYSIAEFEGKYGLINEKGETIIPLVYEQVGFLEKEREVAPVCEDGKWYYLNTKIHKKIVPDETYEYLGVISEDMAAVMKDGKYGFADKELAAQTELKWEEVSHFSDGIAAVKTNEKWALIDDSFSQVTDDVYEDIAMNENGFCCGQERVFAKSKDGYRMLNQKGEGIGNDVYEDARPFETDALTAVKKNSKWGFVDTSGNVVVDYMYEDARAFTQGVAAVKKNGKWGYINASNEMIVEPAFEDAYPFEENGMAPVKNEYWHFIHLYAIAS